MSEQSNESIGMPEVQGGIPLHPEGQIDPVGSASSTSGMQSLGMQQCPNCGARNHANASICLECGEHLRQRPKKIRCRQCGQQASSSLTLCPSCGRELQAAPSRFWTWVVPLGIVLVLAIFLLSRSGGPIPWAKNQAGTAIAWVSGMGEEMDPHMTIIMTPESDTPVLELVSADDADSGQPASISSESEPIEPNGTDSDTTNPGTTDTDAGSEALVAVLPTSTPTPLPTDTPNPAPTATASETPIATSTKAPTSTPTESPTKLPTATLTVTKVPTKRPTVSPTKRSAVAATTVKTATPSSDNKATDEEDSEATVEPNLLILQPTAAAGDTSGNVSAATAALVPTAEPTSEPPEIRKYTVLSGDTLLSIAERFGISVEVLMATNDIAPGEVYTLNVGETLNIVSADNAPLTQIYTIRPGDTFMAIANRFDIATATLQLANGFTDEQVRLLRPGQTLVIPRDDDTGSTVVALAPTAASASPTPSPAPAPTAIPTATPSPVRLDAPVLRSPENNTVVSCQGSGQMAWGTVNFMMPTDEFVMHLGFVNSQDADENEAITWVLNQQRPSNRTSWEMDPGLCGLAPQEYGRQWRWYVEVVDEEGVTVSPPSETWGFSWN
jgi:LysM repeat protein